MRSHPVWLIAVAAAACLPPRPVQRVRPEPALHAQDCAARVGGKVYCAVYRVVLAANGSRVWFLTRSILSGAEWHQYDVAAGGSRDVDKADAWKIWAALRESQARWLVDGIPEQDAIVW